MKLWNIKNELSDLEVWNRLVEIIIPQKDWKKKIYLNRETNSTKNAAWLV